MGFGPQHAPSGNMFTFSCPLVFFFFFLEGGFLDLVITCLEMKVFQKTSFPPISAGNMHKKNRDIFICIFLVSSFQQWPIMSTTSVNRGCRNCFRGKFTSGAHGEPGHRPGHLVLAAATRQAEVGAVLFPLCFLRQILLIRLISPSLCSPRELLSSHKGKAEPAPCQAAVPGCRPSGVPERGHGTRGCCKLS